MQILFSDTKAKSMSRNSTPWDLIFQVCKVVIEDEWPTIEDLQRDISHIDIVDVKMNRAEQGTGSVHVFHFSFSFNELKCGSDLEGLLFYWEIQ